MKNINIFLFYTIYTFYKYKIKLIYLILLYHIIAIRLFNFFDLIKDGGKNIKQNCPATFSVSTTHVYFCVLAGIHGKRIMMREKM